MEDPGSVISDQRLNYQGQHTAEDGKKVVADSD